MRNIIIAVFVDFTYCLCVMKAKAETIQRATVEMSSFSVSLRFLKAQGRLSNSPYLDVPHTFSL